MSDSRDVMPEPYLLVRIYVNFLDVVVFQIFTNGGVVMDRLAFFRTIYKETVTGRTYE